MNKKTTISELLTNYGTKLRDAGIETWQLDCRILLATALDVSQEYILTHPDLVVASQQAKQIFKKLIARRLEFEPIAYILGKKEFMGYEFTLNQHVLIPRPKTEELCEWVIKNAPKDKPIRILDLGTGCGTIAIALLKKLPNLHVDALDYSINALKIARLNADNLGVKERITFITSQMEKISISNDLPKYDMIVSNPPYISYSEFDNLMPDVKLHEPKKALVAQGQGLYFYPYISYIAKLNLKPGGVVVMECGPSQPKLIGQIFAGINYHLIY